MPVATSRPADRRSGRQARQETSGGGGRSQARRAPASTVGERDAVRPLVPNDGAVPSRRQPVLPREEEAAGPLEREYLITGTATAAEAPTSHRATSRRQPPDPRDCDRARPLEGVDGDGSADRTDPNTHRATGTWPNRVRMEACGRRPSPRGTKVPAPLPMATRPTLDNGGPSHGRRGGARRREWASGMTTPRAPGLRRSSRCFPPRSPRLRGRSSTETNGRGRLHDR